MIGAALHEWFPIIVAALVIGLAWFWEWNRKRPAKDSPEGTPYRIYTTEYDVEIRASEIADCLSEISEDYLKYWQTDNDAEWLQKIAAANERATEIEDSNLLLDVPDNLPDTLVALLVDHSGSMRGETITAVAATIKVIADNLVSRGAKVEVLGFTTAGWRGGFARKKWIAENRPKYPGRLCALMHIIYKAADDERFEDEAFSAMLNAGMLYENIDGEALEWAERRLLERPEKQKILAVFSDGAPVDDSTLTQNGPSILYRHITKVIDRLETTKTVTLGAVGVNFRVDEFYATSDSAEDLAELPRSSANLIRRLLKIDTASGIATT